MKKFFNEIKTFFKMITELELRDFVPVNHYNRGLNGKGMTSGVEEGSLAYYEYVNGLYVKENEGVVLEILA